MGISNAGFADFLEPQASQEIIDVFEGDLVFNGVNGVTGRYGLSPMSADELAARIEGRPFYEKHAERTMLEEAQPALGDALLSKGQWDVLLENMTPERNAVLVGLSKTQTAEFVVLLGRPRDYDQLLDTFHKVFASTGEQRYHMLLETLDAMFNEIVTVNKQALFTEMEPAQKALLEVMLKEVWDAFEAEKRQNELADKKTSYAMRAFPLTEDVEDPTDLAQAGWGIVFPAAWSPQRQQQVEVALSELITRRQQQAGPLFHIYKGPDGYRPEETKTKFLQRHRVGPGLADPRAMPFYVLLVGSPEEIPFEFQYQLDVMRGVGRIDFGEDYEAYARYAHNVVLAETGDVKLPRQATFFGASNPDDKATQMSAKYLLRPLLDNLSQMEADRGVALEYAWDFDTCIGPGQATRERLRQTLGGDPAKTPALLLTASHGMEFPKGDSKQLLYQGALLCQEWPGPNGRLERQHYFAAEDLAPEANLLGMIVVLFACYGAGTPRLDQFASPNFKTPQPIADKGFIAALPNELLKRGALAVLGHVERAWGYSFLKPTGDLDNTHFVAALRHLLNGGPVGWATDPGFNLRYADMSSELSKVLEERQHNAATVNNYDLTQMWTANNDARGYVVIGDPAVYIPLAKAEESPAARPGLGEVVVQSFGAAQTAGGVSESQQATTVDAAMDFGLREQFDGLTGSIKKFTNQLSAAVGAAATDILTLNVETYSTSNLVEVAQGNTQNAKIRAYTHIDFDGDMKVYVPEDSEGDVDEELWAIHQQTVREAQANRAKSIQAMAELATNLLKNLKP
ncbi:MAG: hypothetical protein JXR84_12485 [Anaerolineae bacterium]|nr:hypothetical protein [Anaerolineae bacterium]